MTPFFFLIQTSSPIKNVSKVRSLAETGLVEVFFKDVSPSRDGFSNLNTGGGLTLSIYNAVLHSFCQQSRSSPFHQTSGGDIALVDH